MTRRTLATLGDAVNRVTAAAMLVRAVADHVPDKGGKLDCLDAIELHLLRPAAADLAEAYAAAVDPDGSP